MNEKSFLLVARDGGREREEVHSRKDDCRRSFKFVVMCRVMDRMGCVAESDDDMSETLREREYCILRCELRISWRKKVCRWDAVGSRAELRVQTATR